MLCRCMQGVCVSTTLKESTVISVRLGSTMCHGSLEQTWKPMLAKVCSWGEVIEWLCCLAQTKHVNALQPVSMCLHWEVTENTSPSGEKAMQNDTCWDGTVAVRASNQNNAHSDIPKLGKHSGVIFSTSSWVIICLWCGTDELGVDCLKFTITAEHKALNEGSILAMYICTYIYIHVYRYWSCLGMSISFGTSWIIYMFNERGCRGVWEIEGVHMEKSRAEQNWWMAAQKAEANPQASLPPHVSFILWW